MKIKFYIFYLLGFLALLAGLAWAEDQGLSRSWISYLLIFASIASYALIGLLCHTSDLSEYYVAGREVPSVFNGMACAADWISAASFISLAGGIFILGAEGFAYVLGWTGGFCIVGLFIAPYLRRFGKLTLSDYLGARFARHRSDHVIRIVVVLMTALISFVYVTAQIVGVGLIVTRFTGVDFTIGIFLGLASVLVCSFLGGMKAVTWTQVAQYLIIFVAIVLPVGLLSWKHLQQPVPQLALKSALPKLQQQENKINFHPAELEVRQIYLEQSYDIQHKIDALPSSWVQARTALQVELALLKKQRASLIEIKKLEQVLAQFPASPEDAKRVWSEEKTQLLQRVEEQSNSNLPYSASTQKESNNKRNNFVATALCLMLGTAAMPHLLLRFYTGSTVQSSRDSVFWALFFVILIYMVIPVLAALTKLELLSTLVGARFDQMPDWVLHWVSIDRVNPLIHIQDINRDGIVQWAEVTIDGDILTLAMPEIAGLPYIISALVATGGLAAALSTADGLLLTISNAISHDLYHKILDPDASVQKRVMISKLLLLVIAVMAAYAASQRPANILILVGAAFSVAASSLFPVLVAAIFWKRANFYGAISAITLGFSVCVFYMVYCFINQDKGTDYYWFGMHPVAAGIFGIPAGLFALVLVSYFTSPPNSDNLAFVDEMRSNNTQAGDSD